jgi:hypothetical protein
LACQEQIILNAGGCRTNRTFTISRIFYQRGSGAFWIALEGEQVVGSIGLLDIGSDQAALRNMFVAARIAAPHQEWLHGSSGPPSIMRVIALLA